MLSFKPFTDNEIHNHRISAERGLNNHPVTRHNSSRVNNIIIFLKLFLLNSEPPVSGIEPSAGKALNKHLLNETMGGHLHFIDEEIKVQTFP